MKIKTKMIALLLAMTVGVSYAGTTKNIWTDAIKSLSTKGGTINLNTSGTVTVPNHTGTLRDSTDNLSAFSATTSAQLAGVISDETGSGALVFGTSPVFTTPNLGTPSALVGTNITGLAAALSIGGNASTASVVTTNANLTGPIISVGNLTSVAAQTGTGSTFVMNTSPVLVTPNIGTPSAGIATNLTGTATALNIGGNASTASVSTETQNVEVASGTANTDFFPAFFASSSTAGYQQLKLNSGFKLNPSTLNLTANIFTGALAGNATSATTAGNASTVTTNANLTGEVTSVGNLASVASRTGTGSTFATNTSPVFITPNLGTPSVLVATSASGTAASLTAGNVTTNANLTGQVTSIGNLASIASSVVTNSMLVNMAANTVKANATGGAAAPTDVAMTAAATASTLIIRDGNSNASAANFIDGLTSTVTAAGTTTLTVASNYQQYFTGSTTQTVTLPVASTMQIGQQFQFVNNSSGNVTINSSGNNLVNTLSSLASTIITVVKITGTDATSWNVVSGGGFASPMTTQGDVIYGGASGVATRLAQGTANQVLGFQGSNTSPNYRSLNEYNSKNYIRANSDAAVDTTGWTTYSDTQTTTMTIASPAVITVTSTTGFAVGQPVAFTNSGGALPTGIIAGTTYYISTVINSTTLNVSNTNGGTNVNTSGSQSGTHTFRPLLPQTLASNSLSGLTFARNTTTPLRPAGDFKFTQTNSTDVAGQGAYYAFTIDNADQAKPISINFDYNASSTFSASDGVTAQNAGGAGDSDIKVYMYDVTNAVLIPVSPAVITANGANNFTYKATFQTASNSTSYRLALHTAKTSANATGYTFNYTNVYVGAQSVSYGDPITDWVAYTPTFTGFGTVTVQTFYWRRVGSNLQIRGRLTSGTVSGTEARLSFPSRLTSASTITTLESANGTILKDGGADTTNFTVSPLIEPSVTYFTVGDMTSTLAPLAKQNGNTAFGNAQNIAFTAEAPIAGWASTSVMSNDTDTRVVSLQATANAYSATANTAIATWTTNKDSHGAFSGGTYTVPVSGDYDVQFYAATTSGTPIAQINKNGSLYLTGVGSGVRTSVGGIVYSLVAGNTLTVSLNATLTTTSTNTDTMLSIRRISGPSAIAATESVNARYYASGSTITGSLSTVSWTTKDYDSHGGMSAGTYTIPTAGKYKVHASLGMTGTYGLNSLVVTEVQKNGTAVARDKQYAGGIETQLTGSIDDTENCLAGDTIRIQVSNSGTSPVIVTSNVENYFTIELDK